MLLYLNMDFLGDNIEMWSDDIILSLLTFIGAHLEKYHIFPTTIHPSHLKIVTDMTAFNKIYIYRKHIVYDTERLLHTLRSTIGASGGGIVLSFKLMGVRPYVILEVQQNDAEVQTSSLGILPIKRVDIPDLTAIRY